MCVCTYIYARINIFTNKNNSNNISDKNDNNNSNKRKYHTALKKSYLVYVSFTKSAWTFKEYPIFYF